MTFDELDENFGIATTTAWDYAHEDGRVPREVIEFPAAKLQGQVAGKVCLVDSTLLIPTSNWRHHRDLHSGHRKRYGVNLQVHSSLLRPARAGHRLQRRVSRKLA